VTHPQRKIITVCDQRLRPDALKTPGHSASASVRRDVSAFTQRGDSECVSASIERRTRTHDEQTLSASDDAGALRCSRCGQPAPRLIDSRCPSRAHPAGDSPEGDDEEWPWPHPWNTRAGPRAEPDGAPPRSSSEVPWEVRPGSPSWWASTHAGHRVVAVEPYAQLVGAPADNQVLLVQPGSPRPVQLDHRELLGLMLDQRFRDQQAPTLGVEPPARQPDHPAGGGEDPLDRSSTTGRCGGSRCV